MSTPTPLTREEAAAMIEARLDAVVAFMREDARHLVESGARVLLDVAFAIEYTKPPVDAPAPRVEDIGEDCSALDPAQLSRKCELGQNHTGPHLASEVHGWSDRPTKPNDPPPPGVEETCGALMMDVVHDPCAEPVGHDGPHRCSRGDTCFTWTDSRCRAYGRLASCSLVEGHDGPHAMTFSGKPSPEPPLPGPEKESDAPVVECGVRYDRSPKFRCVLAVGHEGWHGDNDGSTWQNTPTPEAVAPCPFVVRSDEFPPQGTWAAACALLDDVGRVDQLSDYDLGFLRRFARAAYEGRVVFVPLCQHDRALKSKPGDGGDK